MTHRDHLDLERRWVRCTWAAGSLALLGYFTESVFNLLPLSIGRWVFFLTGASLSLSAFAFLQATRHRQQQVLRTVGLWAIMISGFFMHAMAVIQDGNFTTMGRRIAAAEDAAVLQSERAVLWGVNNVQLSLDICFDIWITIGGFFLASSLLLQPGRRWLGVLGLASAGFAFGMNVWMYPEPPVEAGGVDGGPYLATWLGLYLWFEIRRVAVRT